MRQPLKLYVVDKITWNYNPKKNNNMKKTLFFVVTMIAMVVASNAQDTILMGGQTREGYLYDTSYKNYSTSSVCPWMDFGNGGDFGKYFYISDSLTVYGIAIGITDGSESYGPELTPYFVHDTSYAHAYERVRIYKPFANSLQCIGQQQLHLRTTPVAYVAEYINGFNPSDPHMYVDMYERYFRYPVTVQDSFYVGMTTHNTARYSDNTGSWQHSYIPLMITSLTNYSTSTYDRIAFFNNPTNRWIRRNQEGHFFLVFPMLLPPPSLGQDTTFLGGDTIMAGDTVILSDTTVVSDTLVINEDTIINYDTIVTYDTILGIDDHGLLGRLTGVMPNPAAETAKVVSSFGMSRVEVYNLAGERVHEVRVPDGSLSATLDLRRLPAGAYLLRIHTPQGVATKKLTVRR